jgi:inorganic phosphate transporter, PiT family
MNFWDAAISLRTGELLLFAVALLVAFGFEFINGFHDTANAVTTVIYTRTLLPARTAVLYSGILNFLGVLLGGTAVAFGIVNLLPVDLLAESTPGAALVTVMALLLAGVIWNLGTWYLGLPVSSSHTLIGSILGVGLASSYLAGKGLDDGVNWAKAGEVGMALLISPVIGFGLAGLLLLGMKVVFRDPRLYKPPEGDDRPPMWVRAVLILTCGGVSFSHGSNDGQKGMGLLLLVLIGFLPIHYAVNTFDDDGARRVADVAKSASARLAKADDPATADLRKDLQKLSSDLGDARSFREVDDAKRYPARKLILSASKSPALEADEKEKLKSVIEYVPLWVVIGTAVALGCGTMVGYKRIVVTVAERIGKTHMTYAQGAAAELITAVTVAGASYLKLPVSTTHVLSSGIAGTMVANRSGIQRKTIEKILLAWVLTLPCCMLLSGIFYSVGRRLFL